MVPEIRLVEIERRVAVELVEDVALGPGDGAQRPERLPAAHRCVADPQMVAVQADGGDALSACCGVVDHPGLGKVGPVPGQTARDRNALGHTACKTSRQVGAVHVQAVREHEYVAQRGIVQPPCELLADRVARLRLGDARGGGPQAGLVERHCGGDHRVIDDRVADDLAGSRATNDGSSFEVAAQLTHKLTGLDQRSGAKDENDTLPFNF